VRVYSDLAGHPFCIFVASPPEVQAFRQHAQEPDGRDIIGQAANGQMVREGVIPDAYGDVAGPSLPPGGTFASRIRDQAEHAGDMT
jgi:hypothetical protein